MGNNGDDGNPDRNKNDELQKARNYLRLLLKHRPRTEAEVRKRLAGKDYSREVIDSTVDWPLKTDLIDERRYAE